MKILTIYFTFFLFVAQPISAATEIPFAASWMISESEPADWARNPSLALPTALTDWKVYTQSVVPPGINKTVWFKNQIPDRIEPGFVLYFANGLEELSVYIDGKAVYSFGQFSRDWDKVSPQRWHEIPLSVQDSGKSIAFRTHYGLSYVVRTLYPRIRPQVDVAAQHISDSFGLTLVVGAALLMGFLSLAVGVVRWQFDLFMYFGIMGLAVASWILFNQDSVIKPFLGVPVGAWMYFDLIGIYAAEIGLISFLLHTFKTHRTLVRILLGSSWGMIIIVAAMAVTRVVHPWYSLPLLHLVVFPSILVIVPLIMWSAYKGNPESRIMMLGAIAVGISVIHDVLRYTIHFHSIFKTMIPLGSLLNFSAMVAVLARRYKGERDEAFRTQAKLLSDIRGLNRVLEQQVEVVEAEVHEKNQEITSILQHIQQGIFMLVEPDLRIHEAYSVYLEELLGTDQLAHQLFDSVFLSRCDLGSDQRSRLLTGLRASLGEDSIGFELNAGNFPHEVHVRTAAAEKIVELAWAPILNDANCIDKILVTARDVTRIRQLQHVAARNQQETRVLHIVLSAHPRRFSIFLKSCRRLLTEARSGMQDLKNLYRNLHTIKGNARSFELEDMATLIHDAEQTIEMMLKDPHLDRAEELRAIISQALELTEFFAEVFNQKFQFDPDMDLIHVSRKPLEDIFFSKGRQDDRELLQQFEQLLLPKVFTDAGLFFEQTSASFGKLAVDLGKREPHITWDADTIYFTSGALESLNNVLGHLLRNALDHGIETPAERLQSGKAEQGAIHIECRVVGNQIRIVCADDGRGLDLDRLRQQAMARGLLNEGSAWNERAIEEVLFAAGFSTKSEVSLISGRGIGLDAVRAELNGLGGAIRLQLIDGVHPQFVVILPASCFFESTANFQRSA